MISNALAIGILFGVFVLVAFLDYKKGLALCLLLLITLPMNLYISFGLALPALTIHRVLLIGLFFFWLKERLKSDVTWQKVAYSGGSFWIRERRQGYTYDEIPFLKLLLLLSLTSLVSLLLSDYFIESLKAYASFLIESVLFYVIIITSIETEDDVRILVSMLCFGIFLVALNGIMERYTDLNLADYVQASDRWSVFGSNPFAIYSTYPHPILLGYGLAVSFPFVMARLAESHGIIRKLHWGAVITMLLCSYYTFSRGPWLAFLISGTMMFLLGSREIKKTLLTLASLCFVALLLKPGVYDTINRLYQHTFNITAVEGKSFYYRFELWRVAWENISTSFLRLLFGYGAKAHRLMDLSGEFELAAESNSFSSWDSELACVLLEKGIVGLSILLLLYLSMMRYFLKGLSSVPQEYRNVLAAVLSSVTIFLFMMTNVKIFSLQLIFLLWTSVSIGVVARNAKTADNQGDIYDT